MLDPNINKILGQSIIQVTATQANTPGTNGRPIPGFHFYVNMKNRIQLSNIFGSDELIALSAWTSTSRDLTEKKRARIPKLLADLWLSGHETPFEKVHVQFLVTSEVASHIHLLKHRISSLNAESARYKELKEDKFYIPEDWKDIEVDMTNMPIHIEPSETDSVTWGDILFIISEMNNVLYHESLKQLEPVLGRKRAKESARFFKMYNSQIDADVTFNLRSFANFLRLRKSEHAQLEIREIAQEMFDLVKREEKVMVAIRIIDKANEILERHREQMKGEAMEELKDLLK